MSTILDRALHIARLALTFGRVERVTFHEDGQRPETDTDHTVMLQLIACDLANELRLGLDIGLVAQFALVHDLVEVYSGDCQTMTLDAAGFEAKATREAAAIVRLRSEFGTSWLVTMLERYERQIEPEPRYVRVLDKLLPKLTHLLNGCVTARALTDREGFAKAHLMQAAKLFREYPDVAEAVHALLREAMTASEGAWDTRE